MSRATLLVMVVAGLAWQVDAADGADGSPLPPEPAARPMSEGPSGPPVEQPAAASTAPATDAEGAKVLFSAEASAAPAAPGAPPVPSVPGRALGSPEPQAPPQGAPPVPAVAADKSDLPASTSAGLAPAPLSVNGRTWESYRVLSDRNMFLRVRYRPSSRVAVPSVPRPPANDDDRIVLTGIIQQGDDVFAFFEDTRTGRTFAVAPGSAIGRGRVSAIALEGVDYACDDRTTKVAVGCNLTGASVVLARPVASPAASAAPSPSSSAAGPTPAPAGAVPPTVPPIPGPLPGIVLEALPATPGAAPAAAVTGRAAETVSPPAAPVEHAAPAPSSDVKDTAAASILERMRQRREQELNR